jgi:3-mercaptopyruvate sulfurtransferase SseA
MADSTNRQVLVETEWGEANLSRPGTVLRGVDEDIEAYGRGHLPGPLGIHWKKDLQDPVRRDFIGPSAFAAPTDGSRTEWGSLVGPPIELWTTA